MQARLSAWKHLKEEVVPSDPADAMADAGRTLLKAAFAMSGAGPGATAGHHHHHHAPVPASVPTATPMGAALSGRQLLLAHLSG